MEIVTDVIPPSTDARPEGKKSCDVVFLVANGVRWDFDFASDFAAYWEDEAMREDSADGAPLVLVDRGRRVIHLCGEDMDPEMIGKAIFGVLVDAGYRIT